LKKCNITKWHHFHTFCLLFFESLSTFFTNLPLITAAKWICAWFEINKRIYYLKFQLNTECFNVTYHWRDEIKRIALFRIETHWEKYLKTGYNTILILWTKTKINNNFQINRKKKIMLAEQNDLNLVSSSLLKTQELSQ
jgi:hypothetical protein